MSRWSKAERELQGYKRKLAYGNEKVSLPQAPWEEADESKDRVDQHVDQEKRNGTGRHPVGEP